MPTLNEHWAARKNSMDAIEELPVLIHNVNQSNFREILLRLAGYAKSCSVLWLKILGLPTLNGLIIDSWCPRTHEEITSFSRKYSSSTLLLRIDRRNERWTSRRGGYVVDVETIPILWKELSLEGFIPILLESASPYGNHQALTAVLSKQDQTMIVESVGAGFDASDILRSDLAPHERWHISLSKQAGRWIIDSPRRSFLISEDSYKEAWKKRLSKIGAKLLNPSFPDTEAIQRSDDQLRAKAIDYLRTSGETLLLDATSYQPLSTKMLHNFAESVLHLTNELEHSQPRIGSVSVAASVISDGRLVFWDFFPVNRFEMLLLWD
jgi:hypothetical protein